MNNTDGIFPTPIDYLAEDKIVTIVYTNHKGVKCRRRVTPKGMSFEATQWHPEPQWIMHAFDHDKCMYRSFALKDVIRWL